MSALSYVMGTGEENAHERNGDKVVVVQGSSRGLGLAFVNHFLSVPPPSPTSASGRVNPNLRVVATTRAKETPRELQKLVDLHGDDRLKVMHLDVEKPETVEACAMAIKEEYNRIDALFNVAGLLHEGEQMPERKLDQVHQSWILRSMAVNAAGPLLVAKAFAPLMKRKITDKEMPNSLICNISARVGSLADNGLGGWYSYRMSKAALNMATVNLAIELKRQRTQVVSMHPGTNRTGLSAPFQKNVAPSKLFEAEDGVQKMIEVLYTLSEDATGEFYAWDGSQIEW